MNFDIKKLIKEALISLVNKQGITDKDDIERISKKLEDIFPNNKTDYDDVEYEYLPSLEEELLNNDSVDFAFQSHNDPNKIKTLMIDDGAQLKPFYRFYNDVKEIIVSNYNKELLEREYNFAIRRAHTIMDAKQIVNELDVFPNIEWECRFDISTCTSHQKYNGRIWAATDPFWKECMPCSDIDCDCSICGTDEPPTDNSNL